MRASPGHATGEPSARWSGLTASTPMIHVWIVPHECGAFAALDGVGGGQIAEGEERACDHAHGSTDPDAITADDQSVPWH